MSDRGDQPVDDRKNSQAGSARVASVASVANPVFQILHLVAIVILIFVAANSVIELAARVSTKAFLQNHINSTNETIASSLSAIDGLASTLGNYKRPEAFLLQEATSDELLGAGQAQYDLIRSSSDQLSKVSKSIELEQGRQREFVRLLNSLSALEFSGSDGTDLTVALIQREIGQLSEYGPEKTSNKTPDDSKDANGLLDFVGLANLLDALSGYRSDMLLMITVVTCGALGTAIAGMRDSLGTETPFRTRVPINPNAADGGNAAANAQDSVATTAFLLARSTRGNVAVFARLGLGAAAGFVVFLALKGGKFLFVVEFADGNTPINPFASAFAGILTGLFTERAYQFLSRLIQRAEDEFFGKDRQGTNTPQQAPNPPAG